MLFDLYIKVSYFCKNSLDIIKKLLNEKSKFCWVFMYYCINGNIRFKNRKNNVG